MSIEYQEILRELLQRAAAKNAAVTLECSSPHHAQRLRAALYPLRNKHPLGWRIKLSVSGPVLTLELKPDLLAGVKVS